MKEESRQKMQQEWNQPYAQRPEASITHRDTPRPVRRAEEENQNSPETPANNGRLPAKLKVPVPEKYGGGGNRLEDFIWAYDNYVLYKGIGPRESGQMISFYLTEQALKEYKSMNAEEHGDLTAIYKRLRSRFRSAGFKMTQQGKLMNATQ